MDSWEIAGRTLEYIDEEHLYLVDGVIVPSITQCLKVKFGIKYAGVDNATLQRAADKGTEVHKAIEDFCKQGTESDLQEVRNFKFLQTHYCFEVVANEMPVILFDDDEPILAGRLDMVIKQDDVLGLADIKRTATLDREYLGYQLNLYRIAYMQCYGGEIELLKGIHLRDDKRKYIDIPIKPDMAWDLIKQWKEKKDE